MHDAVPSDYGYEYGNTTRSTVLRLYWRRTSQN
jgi:hypothetical protein